MRRRPGRRRRSCGRCRRSGSSGRCGHDRARAPDRGGSCASHCFAWWQWRHSTSFSSTKNSRMPASMVAAIDCDAARPLERVRQHLEENRAEQGADRIADEHRHLRRLSRSARRARGDGHRQHAAEQRRRRDPGKGSHRELRSKRRREHESRRTKKRRIIARHAMKAPMRPVVRSRRYE